MEAIWKSLIFDYQIEIIFAHTTFVWDSEASNKAHVHCVIIGFSLRDVYNNSKFLYMNNGKQVANSINPYLTDSNLVFIEKRRSLICAVPEIRKGSQPTDGGNLIISTNEYEEFLKKEPEARSYIREYLGADEFLNGKKRYCLWLIEAAPSILRLPLIKERVRRVKEYRECSKKEATMRGSVGEYQAYEQAGVARLSWRVSGR